MAESSGERISQELEEKVYINAWTPEITKKLIAVKEKAWSYTWIHRENANFLADQYEYLSVIAFSLSFFNGVILLLPLNILPVRIVNILLSFGAGLVSFYIKNKDLSSAAEKHKLASSKFSGIYNNIDRQLSTLLSQRETATHYHRWITTQYDNLYGTAPDIDPPIIERYVEKFAKRRKINPIEAAEFDKHSSENNNSHGRSKGRREKETDSLESRELQEIIVVNPTTCAPKDEDPSHEVKVFNQMSKSDKLDKYYSIEGSQDNTAEKKNEGTNSDYLNSEDEISSEEDNLRDLKITSDERLKKQNSRRDSLKLLPQIVDSYHQGNEISPDVQEMLKEMAKDPNNPYVVKFNQESPSLKSQTGSLTRSPPGSPARKKSTEMNSSPRNSKKLLDYEFRRYNQNLGNQMNYFMNNSSPMNNMTANTKIMIDEYDL